MNTRPIEYGEALAIAADVLKRPRADRSDELSILAMWLLHANKRIEGFKDEWPIHQMAIKLAFDVGMDMKKRGLRLCDCGMCPQGPCCCASASPLTTETQG